MAGAEAGAEAGWLQSGPLAYSKGPCEKIWIQSHEQHLPEALTKDTSVLIQQMSCLRIGLFPLKKRRKNKNQNEKKKKKFSESPLNRKQNESPSSLCPLHSHCALAALFMCSDVIPFRMPRSPPAVLQNSRGGFSAVRLCGLHPRGEGAVGLGWVLAPIILDTPLVSLMDAQVQTSTPTSAVRPRHTPVRVIVSSRVAFQRP